MAGIAKQQEWAPESEYQANGQTGGQEEMRMQLTFPRFDF